DCADHEKSRNERHRKERAILPASHDINPVSEDGSEDLAADDSARGRRTAMSGRNKEQPDRQTRRGLTWAGRTVFEPIPTRGLRHPPQRSAKGREYARLSPVCRLCQDDDTRNVTRRERL